MTQIGKTLLRGHALRHEGNPRYDENRAPVQNWWVGQFRAKCECGELSEPGISTFAARKWHREHKDGLR